MKRADVIAMLERHVPFNGDEGRNRMVALHMLRTVQDVFLRECNEPGHVCGSAIVCNLEGTKVLLNQHGIGGWWMNFGGHADGDEDVFAVAERELEEEAGIADALCNGELFDIDVHYMGPHMRKGQPVAEHIMLILRGFFGFPRMWSG